MCPPFPTASWVFIELPSSHGSYLLIKLCFAKSKIRFLHPYVSFWIYAYSSHEECFEELLPKKGFLLSDDPEGGNQVIRTFAKIKQTCISWFNSDCPKWFAELSIQKARFPPENGLPLIHLPLGKDLLFSVKSLPLGKALPWLSAQNSSPPQLNFSQRREASLALFSPGRSRVYRVTSLCLTWDFPYIIILIIVIHQLGQVLSL